MTGGQAEMGEDLGDHGGIFDGGDDLQGAAALGTLLDVEHPFEQPGETLMRGWRRVMGCITVVSGV
ncbi:MAG: hypothetical protein ACREXS_06395 [Gammaproteobacteria bacterium]